MFISKSFDICTFYITDDFTEGGSLSLMYDKKLSEAQKTVESEPHLLTGLSKLKPSFLLSLYKRSRDGPPFVHSWMLTLFLPLSFVATALC